MRRYYLHTRHNGVFYAELVDPQTGVKLTARSTGKKSRFNNKLRQERFTRDELEKMAAFLNAKYEESPPPRQWFTLNDTGEEI